MFSNVITTAIAALPVLAMAAPAPVQPVPSSPPKLLKTKVVDGYSRFDGLYAEGYHTGAGLNDVILNTTNAHAFPASITDGNLTSTLGEIKYGFQLDNDAYSAWSKVELTSGYGNNLGGVYYYNLTTGSLWYNTQGSLANPADKVEENEFGGWLACDWSKGKPQLFWRNAYYSSVAVPDTCAVVSLIPEDP